MEKLILANFQPPGDGVMLTAAVRDLHRCYPGRFLTDVRTDYPELWENNPYLTPLEPNDPEVRFLECHYPLIQSSNQRPVHFVHGFIEYLNEQLSLQIRPTRLAGDIHLSDEERNAPWPHPGNAPSGLPLPRSERGRGSGRGGACVSGEQLSVPPLPGPLLPRREEREFSALSPVAQILEVPYWLVVAGGKFDFTIKWWHFRRWQAVVNQLREKVLFVQVGDQAHYHPALKGVLDLRGQTSLRDLVRLVYHAEGVLCPVTMLMHLAAAVEPKPGGPPQRPCVVVAGGREPPSWEAYPGHSFLHTIGQLPCCAKGGCWRARSVPLGDGDTKDDPKYLCLDTVNNLPHCMHLITPEQVVQEVNSFVNRLRPGSTGHWPVPSGDSPDGRGLASPTNEDGVILGPASLIPVGGSPTGTGGSPVPPTCVTLASSRDRAADSENARLPEAREMALPVES